MSKKKELKNLSRRSFLKNAVVASTGVMVMPALLTSCKKDDDPTETGTDKDGQINKVEGGFFDGVASFDPSQDKVILWSRYTKASDEVEEPTIILDVSTDKDFKKLVASSAVKPDPNSDHVIFVDVTDLTSNTKYFYRFRNDTTKTISVTGETKTLPKNGEATNVKMAVVSCANFQAGLFNVYGAVAASDADVVIHLGDYIYEYGVGEYGTTDKTKMLGREHKPSTEIVQIDDYRMRYRQYRSDKQLQKAHQMKPFICVWDDHEIANDAYKSGAQNHQSSEGAYETRKANALQVWHEYLPPRVGDNTKIYRDFDFGGIVHLMMLDTRIIGRDKQLDYNDYFKEDGSFDGATFKTALLDKNRTLLGTEQKTWLQTKLTASTANWQVLGSQVLMGKIQVPAELIPILAKATSAGGFSAELFTAYTKKVKELLSIKGRIAADDRTLSAEEIARVSTVLPYNLDSWDGYFYEREVILNTALQGGKNLISIAGDTHNAWHSTLVAEDAMGGNNRTKVGNEFATSSVSSPGFEKLIGSEATKIAPFEQTTAQLVSDLQKLDASKRGYLYINFTGTEANADWRFVSSIETEDSNATSGFTATATNEIITVG